MDYGLGWAGVGCCSLQCVGYAMCLLPVHLHTCPGFMEGGSVSFYFIIAWGSSGFALHSVAYRGQSSV